MCTADVHNTSVKISRNNYIGLVLLYLSIRSASIEKAGRHYFMHMIARHSINKDIKNQKTMWGTHYMLEGMKKNPVYPQLARTVRKKYDFVYSSGDILILCTSGGRFFFSFFWENCYVGPLFGKYNHVLERKKKYQIFCFIWS